MNCSVTCCDLDSEEQLSSSQNCGIRNSPPSFLEILDLKELNGCYISLCDIKCALS